MLDPVYESLLKKIDKLENLNKQLLFENKVLKKRVNERFTDQQDRIESVIFAKYIKKFLYILDLDLSTPLQVEQAKFQYVIGILR